jgi:hypothetical protein
LKPELFLSKQAELLEIREERGAEQGLIACETLPLESLTEVQAARVAFIRAQFLAEIPDRLEQGRDALKASISALRAIYVAGHPDRDQLEFVDKRAFGPQSVCNPPDVANAWKKYKQAAQYSNQGEPDKAESLLSSLRGRHRSTVLDCHLKLAEMTLAWNQENPWRALEYAQQAADIASELERGHWARRYVEEKVLPRVVVIRNSVFPDPLRSHLVEAIDAVNNGEKTSLGLWRAALQRVIESGSPEAVQEAERIDRLLTGFSGPLALLVAFEEMKKAQASGELAETLDAMEAAYFVAFEHGAQETVRQLESALEAAGRF